MLKEQKLNIKNIVSSCSTETIARLDRFSEGIKHNNDLNNFRHIGRSIINEDKKLSYHLVKQKQQRKKCIDRFDIKYQIIHLFIRLEKLTVREEELHFILIRPLVVTYLRAHVIIAKISKVFQLKLLENKNTIFHAFIDFQNVVRVSP